MDAKIESELAELPDEEAAELLAGIGQVAAGGSTGSRSPSLHARVGRCSRQRVHVSAGMSRPARATLGGSRTSGC